MATRFDYSNQARTFDSTRAASPSVLDPLVEALGGPGAGRVLLDVGGGTGNYAAALRGHGWAPVVVDRNLAMLRGAVSKRLPVALADAADLPVPDRSVDAVMLISMIHHVPDWAQALAEARRVVRPGGSVVVLGFTREQIEVLGLGRFFPATLAHFVDTHQTRDELLAALPGASERPILYRDVVDGSFAALSQHPQLVLDPRLRRQTSFAEWGEREHPEEWRNGLTALAAELDAGDDPCAETAEARIERGDVSLFAWTAPGTAGDT